MDVSGRLCRLTVIENMLTIHLGPKSAPIVIASLMWKPFDLRFQSVLAKLKFQQKFLQEELKFATLGQAVNDLSKLKISQAKQATEEAQSEMQSFLSRLLESHNKQTQRSCPVIELIEFFQY
jgi:hypothetical protein